LKCFYCGAELDKDGKICGICGAEVSDLKNKSQKSGVKGIHKKRNGLLALFVVAAIILAGITISWYFLRMNKKTVPTLSDSDSTYVEINENYSNIKVIDSESAIDSLVDIAAMIGIQDAHNEFKLKSETALATQQVYRLGQQYMGIPVFGRDIIVKASVNGDVIGLTSNYYPIALKDTSPVLSLDEAKDQAKEHIVLEYKCEAKDISFLSDEIIVYSFEQSATLAYKLHAVIGRNIPLRISLNIFLNADTGDILYVSEQSDFLSQEYTDQNNAKNIAVDLTDGTYKMFDESRDITIYQAVNQIKKINGQEITVWDRDNYNEITWLQNEKPLKSDVDAMANTEATYDYFQNELSFMERTTNALEVGVVTGIKYICDAHDFSRYIDMVNNAVSGYGFTDEQHTNYCIAIMLGYTDNNESVSQYLDYIAHEYSHGVIGYFFEENPLSDGALSEGYCDIFAECVEDSVESADLDWMTTRDIKNPSNTDNPSSMTEYNSDTSDGHINSTIISHAAYLMWNGGNTTGEWTRIENTVTLAKLWYGSLSLMHWDAHFSQCRNAVELSARDMLAAGDLSYEQYTTVIKSFEQVSIDNAPYQYNLNVKNKFDLSVMNSNNNLNTSCKLKILQIGDTTTDVIWDLSLRENPKIVLDATIIKGSYNNISLENGIYLITVSQDGETPVTHRIVVDGNEKSAETVVIHTDFSEVITVILNKDPATEPSDNNLHSELLSLLKAKTADEIVEFVYDDFDDNGTFEAFGITAIGNYYSEEKKYNGAQVWYVDSNGATMIKSGMRDPGYLDPLIVINNRKFICWLENAANYGTCAQIFGVNDGRPFISSLSGKYNGLEEQNGKYLVFNWNHDSGGLGAYDYELGLSEPHDLYVVGQVFNTATSDIPQTVTLNEKDAEFVQNLFSHFSYTQVYDSQKTTQEIVGRLMYENVLGDLDWAYQHFFGTSGTEQFYNGSGEKDPLNKFSESDGYEKCLSEKVDWIVNNIFNTTPVNSYAYNGHTNFYIHNIYYFSPIGATGEMLPECKIKNIKMLGNGDYEISVDLFEWETNIYQGSMIGIFRPKTIDGVRYLSVIKTNLMS